MRKTCAYFRLVHAGASSAKLPVSTVTSIVDEMIPVKCGHVICDMLHC